MLEKIDRIKLFFDYYRFLYFVLSCTRANDARRDTNVRDKSI